MTEQHATGHEDGPWHDDPAPDGEALPEEEPPRRRRGVVGCLILLVVLLVLLVLLGLAWLGLSKGASWLSERVGDSPEDYPGPGSGQVTFEVAEGDTVAEMGRNLKEEDVVASVDAFIGAANAEPDSGSIQVGFYDLKKEMAAADALEVLLDPDNQVQATVTVPEGLRVEDVVDLLGEETDFAAGQWERALQQDIGLPAYAEGNPEGYLFPATYEIAPDDKPVDVLTAMVDRWREAARTTDLEGAARQQDKTPAEMMIIASLIEAEGRGDDMPKIARVIYNRLDGPGDREGTNGRLQVDASVNYGLDQELGVALTTEQLQQDTPYNTYTNPGLPPTPIEAPGEEAMAAAADPAEGDWYYYVTVDLRTGETKFAETYDEFLDYKAEFQDYCETSDAC